MTNKEMIDFVDCLAIAEFEQLDEGIWFSEIGDSCVTIEASEDRDFVTVDFNGRETLYVSPDVVIEVLLEDYSESMNAPR